MIYGDRIRLRAVEQKDLPNFHKWFNDPEVRFGTGVYLPLSMLDEQDWFDMQRKRLADEHNLVIEIREAMELSNIPAIGANQAGEPGEGEWKMIGGCGFFRLDQKNRSAEFGITIGDKTCWNQGYGTEAVRLLIKHGFTTLNLNRIHLRVLDNNPRAIRAYEKAGFTHEGCQRQAEYKDGVYLNLLVMSILKQEYKE